MNLDQRIRTATIGKTTQLCMHSYVWRSFHRHNGPLTIGRLRQYPREAAPAELDLTCKSIKSNSSLNVTNLRVSSEGSRELSRLSWPRNPSNLSAWSIVTCAISHLWRALCQCGTAAVRMVAVALVFCIVNLLPRPASAAAAAAGSPRVMLNTAVFTSEPSSGGGGASRVAMVRGSSSRTDSRCPYSTSSTPSLALASTTAYNRSECGHHVAGSGCRTSAMPLADLAVSTAGFISGATAGPSGRLTSSATGLTAALSTSRGDLQTASSSSSGRGAGHGPAQAGLELNAPGVNMASTTTSNGSGATNSSGVTNGSGATNGSGGGVISAAPLPHAGDSGLAVNTETVAFAQQLGLGVGEAAVIRLFERHRASVVNISGMRAMQTFTTLDLGKMPYGQGSGFLWGDKGHVVTCYHLVKGAAEVKVTLYDNTSYTAKVLGYDAAKNVAVLKLSVPKSKLRELQPVTLGPAAGLRVGQSVYGIGNPWGLGHTLSQGLVSGLGLELSGGLFPIKGVILVDSAPDPGANGGVLMDSKGMVVGMLVSPLASSGTGCGGGGRAFAVPIDAIRGLINQILAYGRTVRPALGITMAPAQVIERVGLEGVLVLEVPPGSPAHAAGLRPTHRDIFGDLVLGDVVVGLDGKAVRSSADVYDILDDHRVGDRVKLDVVRDGKQTSLTVTLGERLLGAVEE
ncbi:hypothetical protein Vafri_19704 [Volvox africanus]|uniref:PDZ domain-containing protein n=1 Tax=Volvox africanus TaxID=51714 RepID=A0A8J4F8X4_9CHLO|nr:hypothetical protein Vafri_19704 [Volvox africanus]